MNLKQFIPLLEKLADAEWQAVVDGKVLLLVGDQNLMIGDAGDPGVIIKRAAPGKLDAKSLKQQSLRNAGVIL